MRVFRGLSEVVNLKNTVVTTGIFDGVHLGHQVIIKSLLNTAKISNSESLIVTFDPHPRIFLQQNSDLKLISTLDEKIHLLEKSGVANLLIIPFTKEFSCLSSLDFVREILVNQLNTKKLIIGYDHHFGRNREGSFEHLQKFGPQYGFEVQEIPVQDVNQVNVSSSKIRTAIDEGDLELANELLGYSYFISGKVVEGEKLGASLGFPTANIHVDDKYKLIPKNGVYAVKVNFDGQNFEGMLNIGNRPTIANNNSTSIEVNLFNFSGNLYGKLIQVEFIIRIRDEVKFSSLDLLKEQLQKDKIKCSNLLKF